MNTLKLVDIKDSINLLGRSVFSGDKLIMDMTVSGFEFKADFEGDISVAYGEDNGDRKLGLVLDNYYYNMCTVDISDASGVATFNINAKKGEHIVRIVKLSEYPFGSCTLSELHINGTLLDKPEMPKLKFDFYGDSITCGYGNLSPDREPPKNLAFEENGYMTYSALISRYFGADMCVASASGYGYLTACDGTDRLHKEYYNKYSVKNNIEYDFERKPDVIFINFGTNDREFSKNSGTKRSYDDFYPVIKDYIGFLRSKAPNAHIIFVSGVMGELAIDGLLDIDAVYKDIANETDNCYYISGLQCAQLGGNWHPNVDDHMEVAVRLIEKLEATLPEVFKRK